MPLYDYKCLNKDCNNFDKVFEVKQSIKDDKLKKCSCCEKETLEKQITKSNFVLKGIGVYKNNTY